MGDRIFDSKTLMVYCLVSPGVICVPVPFTVKIIDGVPTSISGLRLFDITSLEIPLEFL